MRQALNFSILLISIMLNAPSVPAAIKELSPSSLRIIDGHTEFVAIGKPTMIRIKGEGPVPSGTLSVHEGKVSGHLTLDLKTLGTGIGLRDEHMKNKYLEVEKFKEAVLDFSDVGFPQKPDGSIDVGSDLPFEGKLNLHGETKPVSGKFNIEKENGQLKTTHHFSVALSDFNIEVPQFSGVKVSDHVEVTVTATIEESSVDAKPTVAPHSETPKIESKEAVSVKPKKSKAGQPKADKP